MGRDETTKMAELEALRETTERARIVSVERERMIELDISLARVESTALDERIGRRHRIDDGARAAGDGTRAFYAVFFFCVS